MRRRGPTGLLLGLLGAVVVGGALLPPASAGVAPVADGTVSCTPGLSLNLSTYQGTAPLYVSFALSDVWGPPGAVNWSFGDGSSFDGVGDSYLAPTHLYGTEGVFTASVTLDAGTESGQCDAVVSVAPSSLSVRIDVTPTTGVAPLTVRFSADLSGGTGTFLSALWTFGDGSTASGFNVSYTYPDAGSFNVSFAVVDSADQSAAAGARVTVDAASPTVTHPDDGGASWLDPSLLLGVAVGAALVVAIGLGWRSMRRSRDGSEPDAGLSPDGAIAAPMSPEAGTLGDREAANEEVGSEVGSAPFPVESLDVEAGPPESETEAAAAPPEEAESAPEGPAVPEPRRPKLSQRVLLHIYLQGHLADGEVAPPGFTQRGMAESLGVMQSPLSSVLRRLVVSGLLVQDTRHVRGQDRRLRVYRLTPLGETLARDLYRTRERVPPAAPGSDPPSV